MFCPNNEGDCITINFTSFSLADDNSDVLRVYDGHNSPENLVGQYYGNNSPGLVNATDGCLTFTFLSNSSASLGGWTADISCTQCATPCVGLTPEITAADSELTCAVPSTTLSANLPNGQNYIWSNGTTGSNLTAMTSGIYTVTVTEATLGCVATASYELGEDKASPTAYIGGSSTVLACENSSIILTGSGSSLSGQVAYQWLGAGNTNADLEVSSIGTYSFEVEDVVNGCTDTATIDIVEDVSLAPVINSITPSATEFTCDTTAITLVTDVSIAEGSLVYYWSTGESTSNISATEVGTYAVTVVNEINGCSDIATIDLSLNPSSPLVSITSPTTELNCNISSITLLADVTNGGSLSYVWSTGENTPSISVTTPGSYDVTVTDGSSNCTIIKSIDITENITEPSLVITASDFELSPTVTSITLSAIVNGEGPFDYIWSTGETSTSITASTIGTYSVTVTDTNNNCVASDDFVIINSNFEPFITTWEAMAITGGGNPEGRIDIPGVGNYNIIWIEVGNPSNTDTIPGNDRTIFNVPTDGVYEIRISGGFERFATEDEYYHVKNRLLSIEQWGDIAWTTMERAFENSWNMEYYNATDAPDLSNVTNMSHMFDNCDNFNGDLSSWNTSNVTNMSHMFDHAYLFNGDIGTWDVSNVTDMSYMFFEANAFNSPIGFWNVSNVENMSGMFYEADVFNQTIGFWNPMNVTDMSYMFFEAGAFNQNIGSWNVQSVENMEGMFLNAGMFNQNINNWNVSSVTNMYRMFEDANAYNQPMSSWNVSSVTNMSRMFFSVPWINHPLETWDVSSVTNMEGMFFQCISFNQNINSWNVSNVTNMAHLFEGAYHFDQPLNSWDVSSVTDMHLTFGNSVGSFMDFNQDISSWDVSSVIDMEQMFYKAGNFNQEIGSWDVSNVINMREMFYSAYLFNGDISTWDVSNVTDMYRMFYSAEAFNSNLSSWNPSSVTNMEGMFYDAELFNSDIGGWDVSNVTTISDMFRNAIAFNGDISTWDVSSVADMSNMFRGGVNFNQDIGVWDVSNVTTMNGMFYSVDSFDQNLGNWDISNIDDMEYLIYGTGMSVANYDNTLIGWSTQNVQSSILLRSTGLKYCNGEAARQSLIDNHNWIIISDNKYCSPIVTTWKTNNTGSSNDNQILLPVYGTYDIDWEEVGNPTNSGNRTGNGPTTINFPSAGTYNVSVSGEYEKMDFYNQSGDRLKILTIEEWGAKPWTSAFAVFFGCENLNITAEDAPNFTGITNTFAMFENCYNLNADMSHWNVSNINNASRMFLNATSLDQDLGDWDVSNMSNLSQMLDNTAISTENYDATLIKWSSQSVQNNVNLGANGLMYCDAAVERQSLIDNYSWTFNNDALLCSLAEVYVDHTASGANDGSSWENAFTDLQDALAAGEKHMIHVAKGTYYPTTGTMRGAAFQPATKVTILGGYPNGGGTRNPSSNETKLSGNVDGVGSTDGNSFHVVIVKDVVDVILDGITIRDGNANNANSYGRSRGGGLFVNNATLTLKDVEVKWNRAIYGGGIFATLSPNLTVEECTFKKNTADNGSAIYHSNQTNLYLDRTKIIDNNSLIRCAIEVNNSQYTRIDNSVIADNASANANAIGFIATNRNQTCDIYNSTILGETKNRNLISMQVGNNDQLGVNFYNSIIAHQDVSFNKAFIAYNNNVLNLNTENCYIQGSSVIGNSTNNIYSASAGDLLLNADYSLGDCSPAVDMGNNATATQFATDIDGNSRIVNIVDLGAYEVQTSCPSTREVSSAVQEINQGKSKVQVFPNPVSNILTVKTDLENLEIFVYDILGKRLDYTTSKKIDMSNLPVGIYHLNIFSQGELITTEKIIKQ